VALKDEELLLAKLAEWHTFSVEAPLGIRVPAKEGALEKAGGQSAEARETLSELVGGNLLAHSQHLAAASRELADQLEATTRKARALMVHAFATTPMPSLESRFTELVARWKEETEFEPSLLKAFMNRAYQQIIGLGPPAVPLILDELHREPDHWFWALTAITGEDPAGDAETLEEATALWLEWGETRGVIA